MAKPCQTASNRWLISRYYLHYFPRLTAIYLIFITIFEMKIRPSNGLIVRNLLMPQNINLMHLMQKLTAILSESAAQALQWLLGLKHQHVVDQILLLHRHVRHL